jgi:predicted nucleotidyltransferase
MVRNLLIRTLCYSAVFDSALSFEELNLLLITDRVVKNLKRNVKKASSQISRDETYYYLKKVSYKASSQKKLQENAKRKLEIAKKLGTYFKVIPTINLFAVTGSVAAGRSHADDDIDVLIIAREGTLWTTRIAVLILSTLLGIRRKPMQKRVSNLFCFNMILDTTHLQIPDKEQDIYSAHEIAYICPLWERNNAKSLFFSSNSWIKKYLYHYYCINKHDFTCTYTRESRISLLFIFVLAPFEYLSKLLQLYVMKPKRTNEIIADGYLRFHPVDARIEVLKQYNKYLRMYALK